MEEEEPQPPGDLPLAGGANASDAGAVGPTVPVDNDDGHDAAAGADATPEQPLSKSQQKKLKRQQMWEDGRDDRKRRRKEKRQQLQLRKRAGKAGGDKETGDDTTDKAKTDEAAKPVLVPVSFIFDCDFETYMRDTELISLAGQITRSYSANRTAARTTRIYVSSWGGKLRTRYETLLASQHRRWQNVFFVEDDFRAAARLAHEAMRGVDGGQVVDVLADTADETDKPAADDTDEPSVVYLTSDSPHTLTRLAPHTSYVIGGLVDKNREKGLCYRRAQELGIRTAKLPIGDYMVMASRQVLTTNHVVEIMLQWLATGNWATAFDRVIPKRKGGRLREAAGGDGNCSDGQEAAAEPKGDGRQPADS